MKWMKRLTSGNHSFALGLSVGVVGCLSAGAAINRTAPTSSMVPSSCPECAAEQNAYANAMVDLAEAQNAAETAGQAYYDCQAEHCGGGYKPTAQGEGIVSILE